MKQGMTLRSVQTSYTKTFDGDDYPTRVEIFGSHCSDVAAGDTAYGVVANGPVELRTPEGNFTLRSGMYFAVPGPATVSGGNGFLCHRLGHHGLLALGGPIECEGRLPYIDGCSDTVLVGPVVRGDPCLNFLYIPKGIDQTAHTHPTLRVGIILEGEGECRTGSDVFPLLPGSLFVLHPDQIHSFHTGENSLRLAVYHPDSDTGPNREDHPMVNRTIVNGISASRIEGIRTIGTVN